MLRPRAVAKENPSNSCNTVFFLGIGKGSLKPILAAYQNLFSCVFCSSHVGIVPDSNLLAIFVCDWQCKLSLMFWLVIEKKIVLVMNFGRPQEYQNSLCFGKSKSHLPKLCSAPFLHNAAGVVYITNLDHYLASHYITETVTKLPATAELLLPPLRCCCCHRTATTLPKALPLLPKSHFCQAAASAAKLAAAAMLPLPLPPLPPLRCHHRSACHAATKLPPPPPSHCHCRRLHCRTAAATAAAMSPRCPPLPRLRRRRPAATANAALPPLPPLPSFSTSSSLLSTLPFPSSLLPLLLVDCCLLLPPPLLLPPVSSSPLRPAAAALPPPQHKPPYVL
jgi:hypothetical protein